MKHTQVLNRVAACVVVAAGLVLAINPELVSGAPVPEDTFEAVERRVWWGVLIGLGVLLWRHHQLRPWMQTVAAASAALLFGLLVARLIGIALDGSVVRQWVYVGIEVFLLVASMTWSRQLKTQDDP